MNEVERFKSDFIDNMLKKFNNRELNEDLIDEIKHQICEFTTDYVDYNVYIDVNINEDGTIYIKF